MAEAAVGIQRAQLELASAVRSGDEGKIASAQGSLVTAQKRAADAARDIQRAYIEYLKVAADGDPVREAQLDIEAGYLELQAAIQSGDRAGQIQAQGQILAGQQRARDEANDIIRAQIELAKSLASQDPATQAAYDAQLAAFDVATARGEAEAIRAQIAQVEQARQAREDAAAAELERLNSEFDVLAARAERNPLQTAQIALRRADAAAAAAGDDVVAKNQAMAQRIQAEHAIEDAIAAIADSQIDVLMAMADYAGDTVESAQLALRKAQEQLERLRAQGAGEEAINAQQVAVINAQARARDTDLEKRLGDIDYLQQIGNITTAQAIEMLEAVAQLPDLTEDQVRQIRLKIKSLQDELSGDFQFNLPTFLGVPTAYEARRVQQTIGQGNNYDNRTITIPIAINGVTDPAAVADAVIGKVADVLDPSLSVSGVRRY